MPESPPEEFRQGVPAGEYHARLANVRAAMSERSLSALVVTDPANLFYLTGYDAWSFYTPQCLVVPADGEMRLFARAMDAAGAHLTASLPTDRIHGYPEELVHRPDTHPFDWITARALEHGCLTDSAESTVAVEGDSHFFSARSYLALTAGLPRSRVVDSAELVNWVRLVNTAAVVRDGMQEALAALVPGATGSDVHSAFHAVISRHGLRKDSRIGYSIGIGYPPDWGERTVSLRAEETTVLAPGMAFHVILGMWMDGWGYELSEPVVVTESGAERLTDLPQDLTIRR